jgi:argininosuccinate lyase
LPKAEFQAAHPSLDKTVLDVLGVEQAVRAFRSEGSTHPDKVVAQAEAWRERLAK